MTFKKSTFNIIVITKVLNCKPVDYEIKTVDGWIDSTNTYGFYKKLKYNTKTTYYWYATDLATGTYICKDNTRANCVKWIEKNIKRIEDRKKSDRYRELLFIKNTLDLKVYPQEECENV